MNNHSFESELEEIRKNRIRIIVENQNQPEVKAEHAPIILTGDTFDQFIKDHPIVFVDFWAAWCRPCQIAGPILDELAQQFSGKVWVGKVNVEEHRDLAMKYGANSIPTFWAYINGEPIQRYVGLYSKQTYGAIFQELVKAAKKTQNQ